MPGNGPEVVPEYRASPLRKWSGEPFWLEHRPESGYRLRQHFAARRDLSGGGSRRQFEQFGAILLAPLDIADYPEPFCDVRPLEPAARVNGEVAGERLDMANVPLAEANGRGAEEIFLRGEQRISSVAILVPGDERYGFFALHERMSTAFFQVHHQIVVGDLAVLAGRDILVRYPLGQITENIFQISNRCCACSHFASWSPSGQFALRIGDHQANQIRHPPNASKDVSPGEAAMMRSGQVILPIGAEMRLGSRDIAIRPA